MQFITLKQTADMIATGTIEQSIDIGRAVAHVLNIGTHDSPCRYVIVNDDSGISSVSPDFFNTSIN